MTVLFVISGACVVFLGLMQNTENANGFVSNVEFKTIVIKKIRMMAMCARIDNNNDTKRIKFLIIFMWVLGRHSRPWPDLFFFCKPFMRERVVLSSSVLSCAQSEGGR